MIDHRSDHNRFIADEVAVANTFCPIARYECVSAIQGRGERFAMLQEFALLPGLRATAPAPGGEGGFGWSLLRGQAYDDLMTLPMTGDEFDRQHCVAGGPRAAKMRDSPRFPERCLTKRRGAMVITGDGRMGRALPSRHRWIMLARGVSWMATLKCSW